ncbi:hypothetical protein SteCoe_32787 [Stentor coeruleus]|uniref:Uncharacterized protein n=1 Tax=Stentor coeruleus TaxID=5963 RepID=A0A1R2AYA4_9CILI|nr:hypothetical protein SteCoe_32787 [Stentor coeruleus]
MGCITSKNTDKRFNSIETNAGDTQQGTMYLQSKKIIKSRFARVLAKSKPELRVIYEVSPSREISTILE